MKSEKNCGVRKSGTPPFLLTFYTLLLIVMSGLCGCGGGAGTGTAVPNAPETITIQPADNRLYVGTTKQFSLVSSYTGAITTSVGWASSDSSVASISPTGMLTAIAVGDVTITATVAGVPRTTTVKVIATTFANFSGLTTLNVAGVWKGTYTILEAQNPADIGTYYYEFNLAQNGITVTGTSMLRAVNDASRVTGTFRESSVSGDVLMFNFTYFDPRTLYNIMVNSGFAKITGTTLIGETVENDINGWNCRYRFALTKQP